MEEPQKFELNKHDNPLLFEKNVIVRLLGLKRLIEKLSCLDKYKIFYNSLVAIKNPIQLLQKAITTLNIKLHYDKENLSRIPLEGPVIVVANHPFGIVDGLSLVHMMLQIRVDVKILANFMAKKYSPIAPLCIAVVQR